MRDPIVANPPREGGHWFHQRKNANFWSPKLADLHRILNAGRGDSTENNLKNALAKQNPFENSVEAKPDLGMTAGAAAKSFLEMQQKYILKCISHVDASGHNGHAYLSAANKAKLEDLPTMDIENSDEPIGKFIHSALMDARDNLDLPYNELHNCAALILLYLINKSALKRNFDYLNQNNIAAAENEKTQFLQEAGQWAMLIKDKIREINQGLPVVEKVSISDKSFSLANKLTEEIGELHTTAAKKTAEWKKQAQEKLEEYKPALEDQMKYCEKLLQAANKKHDENKNKIQTAIDELDIKCLKAKTEVAEDKTFVGLSAEDKKAINEQLEKDLAYHRLHAEYERLKPLVASKIQQHQSTQVLMAADGVAAASPPLNITDPELQYFRQLEEQLSKLKAPDPAEKYYAQRKLYQDKIAEFTAEQADKKLQLKALRGLPWSAPESKRQDDKKPDMNELQKLHDVLKSVHDSKHIHPNLPIAPLLKNVENLFNKHPLTKKVHNILAAVRGDKLNHPAVLQFDPFAADPKLRFSGPDHTPPPEISELAKFNEEINKILKSFEDLETQMINYPEFAAVSEKEFAKLENNLKDHLKNLWIHVAAYDASIQGFLKAYPNARAYFKKIDALNKAINNHPANNEKAVYIPAYDPNAAQELMGYHGAKVSDAFYKKLDKDPQLYNQIRGFIKNGQIMDTSKPPRPIVLSNQKLRELVRRFNARPETVKPLKPPRKYNIFERLANGCDGVKVKAPNISVYVEWIKFFHEEGSKEMQKEQAKNDSASAKVEAASELPDAARVESKLTP